MTLYHKVNAETINVGVWTAEEFGEERKIAFKPLKPIMKSDEGIWKWLGNEITKIGRGSISEKGDRSIDPHTHNHASYASS